ncbi:MAG TPA: serine/threonine-protein kinase, partial [bacterium]|nr:serine/threonine-protein kinase [bacterium]
MAGERVQRYELVEQIGLGGMAEVYRARQVDAGGKSTDVVIKKILPHLSRDPQYRTMFIDEAKIASTLRHPNIVQLLELGDMDGALFLALEFVDGADGKALLSRAMELGMSVNPAEALFIAREVLKGLHYAHIRVDAQGVPMQIVHRDVSPQNVFLSRRGEAKLGDFGIATAATRGGKTVVGVVKGNPLYMAPEQVRGGGLDARTDIYAAGLLLLALLCGRHPAEDEPLAALLNRALNAQVPRPSDVNRALPEEIDLLVLRATMLDPAHRYQTALEFAQAIDTYAANNGLRLDARPISSLIEALFPARLPAGEDALPPVMLGTLAAESAPGAPVIVEGVSVLDASDPRLPARTPPPAKPTPTPPPGPMPPAWDDPLLAAPGLEALFGPLPGKKPASAPAPAPAPWESGKAKPRPPTAPWEKAGAVPNLAPPKPAGDTRPSPPAPAGASASGASSAALGPATKPKPAAPPPPPPASARKPESAFDDDVEDDVTEEEHTPSMEGTPAPRGSMDPLEALLLEQENKLNSDRTNPQIPSAELIAAAN